MEADFLEFDTFLSDHPPDGCDMAHTLRKRLIIPIRVSAGKQSEFRSSTYGVWIN